MRIVLALLGTALASGAQRSADTAEIVAKVSPAVVLIKGESATGTIQGSGLVVSKDGKIATNLHVIRDLKIAGVQLASGEIFDAPSVLAFDERKDLAIIKVPGFDLPVVELGNSNELRSGEPVIAIGSPRGLQATVTTGVVSAVRDDPRGGGFKLIQTDAAVNPGNSSGPLLNATGQAIGILTAKLGGSDGLNFAVPINYVRGMLDNLQKAMSLEELRANLGTARIGVSAPFGFPALWKSLSSGKVQSLRVDGDYIYAEAVLPEEERTETIALYELKKIKDGAYRGLFRSSVACHYIVKWTVPKFVHCKFQNQIEFTNVTPARIEGRVAGPPEAAKLDCRKCTYSQDPEWTTLVWIPQASSTGGDQHAQQ